MIGPRLRLWAIFIHMLSDFRPLQHDPAFQTNLGGPGVRGKAQDNLKGDLRPWQNPLLSSPLLSVLGPGPALLLSRRRTPVVSQRVSELSVSTAHSSWCSCEASAGPPFLSSCLFFLLRTLFYLKEQKLESQWPLASRHKSLVSGRIAFKSSSMQSPVPKPI